MTSETTETNHQGQADSLGTRSANQRIGTLSREHCNSLTDFLIAAEGALQGVPTHKVELQLCRAERPEQKLTFYFNGDHAERLLALLGDWLTPSATLAPASQTRDALAITINQVN